MSRRYKGTSPVLLREPLEDYWRKCRKMRFNHLARNLIIYKLTLVLLIVYMLPGDGLTFALSMDETKASTLYTVLFQEKQKEIEDERLKQHISSMVDEIFAENRNLLEGVDEVIITRSNLGFLQSEGSTCNGSEILGAHAGDTIIIRDAGAELNRATLFHEIGHNIWARMDRDSREHWAQLFRETPAFITSYASTNPNENFAENFACYFTDAENCTERMMPAKARLIEKIV